MKRLLGLCVTMCLAATMAPGAYLETDASSSAPDSGHPVRPIPPMLPPTEAYLPSLAQQVTVGSPMRWAHLTFYPLELPARRSTMRVLTLDEALRRDQLAIREVGDGEVSRLAVRNDAGVPVFLMAGELILGGKQNRMMRDDVVLGRHSGWREIAVYCGEQHRWTGAGDFRSGGTLSTPSLRKMAAKGAGQDHIWREIGSQLEAADVAAPTANYHQLFDSPQRRRQLDECVSRLQPLPGPRTVGCVVVGGHHVVGGDLFSDPDLFASLWPQLCRSYGADVVLPQPPIEHYKGRRHAPHHGAVVRQFLDAVSRAHFSRRSTPGDGVLWGMSGAAEGTSLEAFGGVVHAGLFGGRATIQPEPRLHNED